MSMLKISGALIAETVDQLRASTRRERVVLWLGEREGNDVTVREVFLPIQQTSADYFRIPSNGMDELFASMRGSHLIVAGQVHTHPHEAFHSPADDAWAIVRHEGGLSLVVPQFCQLTTVATFVGDTKVFRLDADDMFVEVAAVDVYTVVG